MYTPLVLTLAYLSSAFLLGLVLGWLLWQFGRSKEMESVTTEVEYWKNRLEQSRTGNSLDENLVTVLKQERDDLRKRLKSALSDKSQ